MDVVLAVALLVAVDIVTLGFGFYLLVNQSSGALRPRQVWLLSLVGVIGLPVLLVWRMNNLNKPVSAGAPPR